MMADKMATRKAYGETLVELGAENPDLVVNGCRSFKIHYDS